MTNWAIGDGEAQRGGLPRLGWLCLGVSLCVHAALLAFLPGLASPRAEQPRQILVSLVVPAALAAAPPQPLQSAGDPRQQQAAPLLAAQPQLPEHPAQSPARLDPPALTPALPPSASPIAAPELVAAGSTRSVTSAAEARDGESALAGEGTPTGANAAVPPPVPAPSQPAAAKSSASAIDVKALLSEYAAGVKSAILREKAYPGQAERLGHEGAVKLGFTVAADGALQSVAVKASSGYDELDAAALSAVRDAAPFDPLPQEAGRRELALSITLRFSLN